MKNRIVTWKDFDIAIDTIAHSIQHSKLQIDNIYGIPRGGLILAVALSHKLNKPVLLDTEYKAKNTLIVDDISDSGKTLNNFINPEFITATMFYYPESSYKPTIWIFEKQPNEWIVFPWENKINIKQEKDNIGI